MPPFEPIGSDAYREYADLLLRHHHLLAEGKEDVAETEDVENRLTEIWEKLDDAARGSLNGMGADLNWVRRRGAPPPKGRKPEEVTGEDKHRLAEAEARNDWHAVLHWLRMCAPVMAVEDLARRRAVAYAAIGLLAHATAFHELSHPGPRHFFLHVGGIDPTPDFVSFARVRDPSAVGDPGWAVDVSAEEEYSAFLAAHANGIADDEGNLYGVIRTAEGGLRDIGWGYQQVATFSRECPNGLWGGSPARPLNDKLAPGLPLPKARPPKEVLRKMERAGLISPGERMRLSKGDHV